MRTTRRIGNDGRPFPRTPQEWRARIRDAMRFGERVAQPLPGGSELVHRVVALLVVALLTGMMLSLAAAPAIGIFGRTVGRMAERFSGPIPEAELPHIAQRSVVVDRNGKVLATLAGEENRTLVPLNRVPVRARRAVLAIEDAKFYDHHGVDLAGLARAVLSNVRAGAVQQGGSTITQQLVKNTIVGNERSIDRKIREARLAVELEKKMSKDQILEAYLNEAYFGNGVYGIGTAAEFYFGKPVEKLTLAQAALLAGIIKAPENYEPLKYPKKASGRRALVLRRMAELGWISENERRANAALPLGAKRHALADSKTPFFVDLVKEQIQSDPRFGATRAERAAALFQAGLRIETTLDVKLQDAARQAVTKVLDRKNDPSGALVSIDAKTGAVRAMVSGRDAKESIDVVYKARRQPGSTFKPFTMLAALDAGMTPATAFDSPSPLNVTDPDTGKPYIDPSTGKQWTPNNYDERGRGVIDMREATAFSVNTYYVQMIMRVGPRKVVEMARKLGIETKLGANPSLALGTSAVSPYELTAAYATLANDGVRCKPFTISKVTDASGKVIFEHEPDCERVIDAGLAAQATSILRLVPEQGTGRANGRIGRPVAGKTGTTDNYYNSWYAGYTPQYATVVWLGYDHCECKSLYNIHGLPQVFGGSLPAQIWSRYMRAAHAGLPVEGFPSPPAAPTVTMPDVRGKSLADARKTLEGAGFYTVTVNGSGGTVASQDPAPGTSVARGAPVTLTLSEGASASSPTPTPASSPASTSSPTPKATPSKKKKP